MPNREQSTIYLPIVGALDKSEKQVEEEEEEEEVSLDQWRNWFSPLSFSPSLDLRGQAS